MRFAHVSDLHLSQAPEAGGVARERLFSVAEAIALDIRRISAVLDFVVVSGDLTDDADPDTFRQFESLFAPIGLPVFTVPGNHDGPSAYVHAAKGGLLAENDISGRVVEQGDLSLVGIDTCIEGATTGTIAPADLELLERTLAPEHGRQFVIVMHHPPCPPGLRQFDDIARLERADVLADVLQSAGTAPIVLSGHVHRAYHANWHGARVFVAGSPAMPYGSDLPFGDSPIRPVQQEAGYFVHSVPRADTHTATWQPVWQRGPGR